MSRLHLCLCLGLTACGYAGQPTTSSLASDSPQSFQDWCQAWQLDCSPPDSADKDMITQAQWLATSAIARAALASPSSLSLSRQDLAAAEWKAAASALHLEDVYQEFQTKADEARWTFAELQKGALVSHVSEIQTLTAGKGLMLTDASEQKIGVDEQGIWQLTGLSLGSAAVPEASDLQSLTLDSDNLLRINLADRQIQQVPQWFVAEVARQAFGLDQKALDEKIKNIKAPDAVAAAGPLLSWFNHAPRKIALDRSFFTEAAPQLETLLPENSLGLNLGNLLKTLEQLRTSTDASARFVAINLIKGSTASCDLNSGEVKIKFSAEFGIKRFYQVDAATLGLEFFGLEVTAKQALGIPIKLKRVEFGPEKITIRDIPLVGSVEIPWDDATNSNEKSTLVCGK